MVSNYCVGGVPQGDGTFDYPRVYQGDLVLLEWHSKQNENGTQDNKCALSFPDRSYNSPWIAVIIDDKSNQGGCSLSELLNQSITFINASTIIFLRDGQTAFNQPATDPPVTSYFSSFHTPFSRRHLDRRQRSREGLEQGAGDSAFPSSSPLLISLPLDMFSDLPSQLAIASNSTQVAVTGDIVLFAEPLTIFNLSAVEANGGGNNTTDLSSSLLLLLIVCVLILLLGVLLVPARLGICFWQRFCSFSISRSVKSRRSRKLTAATKKALKQLPVKCLNQVDPLISEGFDQCAICIELFKPQDLIRSLPCRHMYHRACIDPWLLKHRSCPLCKQNILIACGLSLTKEDIESCSATTSEVNSTFSLSSTSNSNVSTSISSPGMNDGALCLPLLTILSCRRYRRHRRRQHPYRYMEHLRRPSSSLDEVSAPSAGGGRRVLGSASENSSSRSVPSDLYFHGNLGSEKGARLAVEEYEEEGNFFAGRRRRGGSRFLMFRQGRLRHSWRTRNLVLSSCCCSSSSGGTEQVAKKREIIPPLPQQQPSSSLMCPLPPSVAHQSAMLLYHLPQSLPFNQMPSVAKSALPSYEQATALMPQATFVPLPGPLQPPPPPVAFWNPHFTSEAHHQMATTRFFDSQPPPNRSGVTTNVVYAVLSNSAARMSVTGGTSSTNPAPTKWPIFVDVNPSLTRSPGALLRTSGSGLAHQCLLSGTAPVATAASPPLVIQPRGESPPPAYSFATGNKLTAEQTPLHPIRRAARFLATHFLSPQPVKQLQHHQHHCNNHQQQQSRHRYCTSFLVALKPSSLGHHHQHCDAKIRMKTRIPRRLHEVTPASIIMTRNGRRHSRHGHRRGDRECQRGAVSSGGGVLAKTLDLTHEGLIMTAAPMRTGSVNVTNTPSAGKVVSPSVGHKNSPKSGGPPPQRLTTHSNSESSNEGTHQWVPLRHTRVRSVRVTVEPQIQYHMERDAASCEALHDTSLLTLSGSKISLPRSNSFPISLKSVNPDGAEINVIKVSEDEVPATALWHCRPSAGSAPALCHSPNNNTSHYPKPSTDILNRSDIILHSSSSS
nr:ring finger protein 150 [Hymenolepis microstoma]